MINEKLSASASKLDRRSESVQKDWMLRVLNEEFASNDECDSDDSAALVLSAIALLRVCSRAHSCGLLASISFGHSRREMGNT